MSARLCKCVVLWGRVGDALKGQEIGLGEEQAERLRRLGAVRILGEAGNSAQAATPIQAPEPPAPEPPAPEPAAPEPPAPEPPAPEPAAPEPPAPEPAAPEPAAPEPPAPEPDTARAIETAHPAEAVKKDGRAQRKPEKPVTK